MVLLTPLLDTREAGVIAPSPIFPRLVFLPSWVTHSFCTEKATGGLVCLIRHEDQNRGHPCPRRTRACWPWYGTCSLASLRVVQGRPCPWASASPMPQGPPCLSVPCASVTLRLSDPTSVTLHLSACPPHPFCSLISLSSELLEFVQTSRRDHTTEYWGRKRVPHDPTYCYASPGTVSSRSRGLLCAWCPPGRPLLPASLLSASC